MLARTIKIKGLVQGSAAAELKLLNNPTSAPDLVNTIATTEFKISNRSIK
jgi:hypothetical protein